MPVNLFPGAIKRWHYSLICRRGAPPLASHTAAQTHEPEEKTLANSYAVLEQESLLHIEGPDAQQFLQGQVTCDAREVNFENARPGIYCTPQGRTVCDFLLCQLGDQHLGMRMRSDLRLSSSAVFGKYIIFSKAELDAENDDWQIFGCWGDTVGNTLKEIFGDVPAGEHAAVSGNGFCVVQTDSDGARYECYIRRSQQPALIANLQATLQVATESAWQLMDIDAGIARIQSETSGEFVPQMLNFDLTGHISFSKGCYTGQEVVARLHYRGTPKRRLYRVALPTARLAQAGEPIYGSGDQSVGNLVNCAQVGEEDSRALVVATASKLEEGLHLEEPAGPLLALMDLPYPVTSD